MEECPAGPAVITQMKLRAPLNSHELGEQEGGRPEEIVCVCVWGGCSPSPRCGRQSDQQKADTREGDCVSSADLRQRLATEPRENGSGS